jgi:predicted membrane protein
MTADEPRVRVTTNLAFGICLILLGSVLILDRLGLVAASELLRFWPVALVLVGAALVIQSFQRSDGTAAHTQQQAFNGGHVIAWIIVAAVMSQVFSARGTTTRSDASERVDMVAVMGRYQQVSSAPALRGAEITTIMGRAELDLRKATPAAGDEVVIEVFTLMGESGIRVPAGWQVDLRATPIMGGARDRRGAADAVIGAPRIVVRGFVMWGAIVVRS